MIPAHGGSTSKMKSSGSSSVASFSSSLDRARNDADVLRREFLQRRGDGCRQRIILLEQNDAWLRHICIGGFRTSRHLDKPLKI